MKSLADAFGAMGLGRGRAPDPRSPDELERFVLDRRTFPIERLEDALAQLPDDAPERPALERELEVACLQAEVRASRPAGCWCLGLGGAGRVYLQPEGAEDPLGGWRTWCRCDAGQAQRSSFFSRKAVAGRLRLQRNIDAFWGSVPEAFRGWTLDSLAALGPETAALAAAVRGWLEGDSARWLYLFGPAGRAKTGAAVCALGELVNRGQTGMYQEVRDLLWHLRSSYADVGAFASEPDRRWFGLVEAQVLVLDDLGAERATDWATETLGQLVAIRHRRLLRTIVTSNLDLPDLGEHLKDARTSSRIKERALVLDCSLVPNLRRSPS